MHIRECVVFILRDKEGRVLLQHRTEDAPRYPNYWGFFGGWIEEGEIPEETVRREAQEELEIELKDLKFFKKYNFPLENRSFNLFAFIAPLTISIEKLKKQQKEGQGLDLFSFEELKDLEIPDHDRVVLKDLFHR